MLLAAYGSLRVGDYNYQAIKKLFGEQSLVPITRGRIPGFALYNLKCYPAAVIAPQSSTIMVDLLAANSSATSWIDEMEQGAGYQPRTLKLGDKHKAVIYVYPYLKLKRDNPLIPEGDWLKFKATKQRFKTNVK